MVRVRRSFLKDIARSLWRTRTRFLSVFAMITLGVGFFAGINATRPDMLLSADRYYQEQKLSDFRIVSPLGFRDQDLAALRQTPGVATVETGSVKDIFLTTEQGATATVRLYGTSTAAADTAALNRPIVREGRLPERTGEIAIEAGRNVPADIRIGTVLTASLPTGSILGDSLRSGVFTVVGRVSSPLYIDFERGQTNIGDGSVGWYGYAVPAEFIAEHPTDVFVRLTGSESLPAYSQAYKDQAAALETTLKQMGDSAVGEQTQALRDELDTGKAELATKKADAEQKLAEGEQKLADAEKEIADGEITLNDNETRYTRELADKRTLLQKGRDDLADGKALYNENHAKWLAGYDAWLSGRDQLQASRAQLDASKAQLEQGQAEQIAGQAKLAASKAQLDSLQMAIAALQAIRLTLPAADAGLSAAQITQLVAQVQAVSPELAQSLQGALRAEDPAAAGVAAQVLDGGIAQMEASYAAGRQAYDSGLAQSDAGAAQLAAGQAQYEQGLAAWTAGQAKLNASKAQLDAGKVELDKGKATLNASETKLKNAEAALTKGEKDLIAELADGRAKLAQARLDLADGRATFATEKADAERQIADAEVKIRDAEHDLLGIPSSWFVLSRDSNPRLCRLQRQCRPHRRGRPGVPAVLFPGGRLGLPDNHDPHGRRGAHPDRHPQGARLQHNGNRLEIPGLRASGQRLRHRGRSGDRVPRLSQPHHGRLRHHVRRPVPPDPGASQLHGHFRRHCDRNNRLGGLAGHPR